MNFMAMGGVSGIGYGGSYGYGSDYESWVSSAKTQEKELQESLGISSGEKTESTGKTNSTGSSGKTNYSASTSANGFLRSYQTVLTDLEEAAGKLDTSSANNVFSQYDKAVSNLSKAVTDEEKQTAQKSVDKAMDNIVSAMQDFADEYNRTTSFLKANSGSYGAAADGLSAFKRSMTTEKALKTVGMSLDTSGNLQVNEKELREKLSESYDFVKETVGGQFGIAERVGNKATSILDSPASRLLNSTGSSEGTEEVETYGTNKTSPTASSRLSSAMSSSNSFTSFANFAKGGAFNLGNYYTVGMLLNTLA